MTGPTPVRAPAKSIDSRIAARRGLNVDDGARATFTVCMVGAHGSGKTSYLGAVWSGLRSDEDTESDLVLDGPLPDGTAYLDAAAYALEGLEAVERTATGTGEQVELPVRLRDEQLQLRQLDIAGESLEHILKDRSAPEALVEWLAETDGIMLFVSPKNLRQFNGVLDARALERSLGGKPEPPPEGAVSPSDRVISDEDVWSQAPTAVQLVDLLQVAAHLRNNLLRPLPVAVVVSAWDMEEPGLQDGQVTRTPEAWLADNLPLLQQFLTGNPAVAPFAVFGVSAQGWDYSDAGASEARGHLPLRERVRVAADTEVTGDLHAPIIWLLDHAR